MIACAMVVVVYSALKVLHLITSACHAVEPIRAASRTRVAPCCEDLSPVRYQPFGCWGKRKRSHGQTTTKAVTTTTTTRRRTTTTTATATINDEDNRNDHDNHDEHNHHVSALLTVTITTTAAVTVVLVMMGSTLGIFTQW